jgi:nitrogen-specific signal transduction histidine kinase
MFEPFFTTREKGTGLGLAFVREILDDHGGALSVRSEAGTTVFEARLPAA